MGIARTLMQEPKLILADEPVASLDPVLAHSILQYLEQLNKDGITVICSLHFLDLVHRYATRVIGLKDGVKVFEGLPQEIDRTQFKEVYGEEAQEVRADLGGGQRWKATNASGRALALGGRGPLCRCFPAWGKAGTGELGRAGGIFFATVTASCRRRLVWPEGMVGCADRPVAVEHLGCRQTRPSAARRAGLDGRRALAGDGLRHRLASDRHRILWPLSSTLTAPGRSSRRCCNPISSSSARRIARLG